MQATEVWVFTEVYQPERSEYPEFLQRYASQRGLNILSFTEVHKPERYEGTQT